MVLRFTNLVKMNEKIKALVALLGTFFLWSFMVVIVRDAVSRTDSVVLLFFAIIGGIFGVFANFYQKPRVEEIEI